MRFINNFLRSGHQFTDDENLQKFRFALLNSLMLLSLCFCILNYFASAFGVIDFGSIFEMAMLIYSIVSVSVIFIVRKQKSTYPLIVNYFIISSLILFYFVLLTRQEDEFRLIAFFLAIFIANVLLGKIYGLLISVFIIFSILIISQNFDLELSPFAYSTFFTFFIIFTSFLYIFLGKVERDAIEFENLNSKLKQRVSKEKEQREEQEQMLLRQCRMASMGEMLDTIAHQWRQPLMHINSILLNMDNALDTKESKKKNKEFLDNKIDEISALTGHMSQTIEDFRNLFKIEKEQTHFKLKSVMDDVLFLMKNHFQDITIDYKQVDDVSILSNKSELMQVMIIILGNAIEALKKSNIDDKKIHINIQKSKQKLSISIEDNAGGIEPEYISKIFDPYFTSKKQSGGTGLGLYIAKIIIENNIKGKLIAKNTSKGAKFTILL